VALLVFSAAVSGLAALIALNILEGFDLPRT